MSTIRAVRIYDHRPSAAGKAFLVDRVWPRGMRKDAVQLDGWARDAAPSAELRRWFGHDPQRWPEFRRRYAAELDDRPQAWAPLLEAAGDGPLTLLYAARDTEHNNAVALRDYLRSRRG